MRIRFRAPSTLSRGERVPAAELLLFCSVSSARPEVERKQHKQGARARRPVNCQQRIGAGNGQLRREVQGALHLGTGRAHVRMLLEPRTSMREQNCLPCRPSLSGHCSSANGVPSSDSATEGVPMRPPESPNQQSPHRECACKGAELATGDRHRASVFPRTTLAILLRIGPDTLPAIHRPLWSDKGAHPASSHSHTQNPPMPSITTSGGNIEDDAHDNGAPCLANNLGADTTIKARTEATWHRWRVNVR